MRIALQGLLVVLLSLPAAPAAAVDVAPWPNLTLPGTPEFWAGLAGWHASRIERVRLLRDLVLLFRSSPA